MRTKRLPFALCATLILRFTLTANAQQTTLDYFSIDGQEVISVGSADQDLSFDAYSKATGGEFLFRNHVSKGVKSVIAFEKSGSSLPAFIITDQQHVVFRKNKLFSLNDFTTIKESKHGTLSWNYNNPGNETITFTIYESTDGIDYAAIKSFTNLPINDWSRIKHQTVSDAEKVWVKVEVHGSNDRNIYTTRPFVFDLGDMSVNPTIADDFITVEFTHKQVDQPLVIVNAVGQIVKLTEVSEKTKVIDISTFPQGTYFVSLPGKAFIRSKKIIIKRD